MAPLVDSTDSAQHFKKRDEILRAAKKLFLEQGYEKTSVRQIVEEANTSMGNLYHHFPDKWSILKAICKDFVAVLRRQIQVIHGLALRPELGFALDFRIGYLTTLEDPKMSRLWLLVRNFPEIHEYSLENKRVRLKTFFGDRFTEEEYNFLAVAIQGIADSFFALKRQGNLADNSSVLSDYIIDFSLRLLGYSRDEIAMVLKEVNELIKDHPVVTTQFFEE
ncbi:MAG: TetR/AcrR family transcriptional regulator [candidate division KSB1 bacterium]|nr:TetR/AcrR family transcriptional regulator [candidate division KSB1 bacterium]